MGETYESNMVDESAVATKAERQEARKAEFEEALAEFDRLHAVHGTREAKAFGLELIETYPEFAKAYAKVLGVTEDPAEALEIAELGLSRTKAKPGILKTAIKLARRVRGHEAEIPFLRRLAEFPDEAVAAQTRVAVLCLMTGDGRGALEALDAAEKAGARPEDLLLDRVKAAAMLSDVALTRQYFEQLPPEQAEEIGRTVLSLESRANAIAVRKESGRLRSLASEQLKGWAKHRRLKSDQRRTSFITESGDILGDGVPGSRSVLVVFGGIKEMVGAALPRFGETLGRYRINALYLSDPRRMLLMGGLATFGDYDQSVAGMKRLFESWGIERIYCLGFSAGGYPAISYGLDLGAHRVLTFAAPTTLTGEVSNRDGRARVILNRIRAGVHRELDLRLAMDRYERPPQIISYFGAEMPQDAAQARHLEGAPNVSLRPLEGLSTHGIVPYMMERGMYEPALEELLADRV